LRATVGEEDDVVVEGEATIAGRAWEEEEKAEEGVGEEVEEEEVVEEEEEDEEEEGERGLLLQSL